MKRFLLSTFFPNSVPRLLVAPPSSSKRPVVVLILGWGGATQRNLKKVVSYYEEKGMTSVTMVAPLFVPLVIESYFEDLATSLLLQQSQSPPPRYFAHIFSNNGSWSFHNFMNRLKFDKIIMDSGPAAYYETNTLNVEASQLSRVFTSIILQKNIYYHAVISPILHTILLPYILCMRGMFYLQDRMAFPMFPNYLQRNIALRDTSPMCPHLFICSTGDAILEKPHTVAQRVETFRGHLAKRGVPTAIHVFDNEVPHTSSFYLRNVEYRKLLDDFLEIKD